LVTPFFTEGGLERSWTATPSASISMIAIGCAPVKDLGP
jgi:hypothetical protein